jgi:hypothetical protein
MSAEFLNFGVSKNQSLSQSSSPSIVVSESEDSDPLANIASAQHLENYADTSTVRNRSMQLANEFGLEEIIDIGAPKDVSEIVDSSDSEESEDLRTKSEEMKVPKEPDQTPAPNVAKPPPSLDMRMKMALGLMTLGLPLALATMGISFAAAGGAAIPHWLELAAGLGAPGLFLGLVGLGIYIYSRLVPPPTPAPRLQKALTLAETQILEAPPAQRRRFEHDLRFQIGAGITTAGLSVASTIGVGITFTMPELAPVLPSVLGGAAGIFGSIAACLFYYYFVQRGFVRQTEANMT